MTTAIQDVIKQATIDVRAKLKADPNYDPKDNLIPKQAGLLCDPECEVCGGIGYYRHDLPVRDAQFGKIYPCKNRDLPVTSRYGLDKEDVELLSWAQLKPGEGISTAAGLVQETLERGHGWVYLWGSHGLAKSLILKIVVAGCLRKRSRAAYTNMADILANLREAFDTDYPSQESINRLNFWADIPVLCIDEFDRINKTAYTSERTFSLMDKRYENACRGSSVTFIASNQSPENLGESYLADRIRDGRFSVFELTGDSMRPGMK